MEWLTAIRKAIDFIEDNLMGEIGMRDVADNSAMPPLLFCRGFQIMTGYSVSEYIRNRRLYLAALELSNTQRKVIDIALDYGYDAPESFSKAFTKFHGCSPAQVRKGVDYRTFLPLNVTVTVSGGENMDCTIAKMFGFKVIGFYREFGYENAYELIPKFWDEVCEKYANNVYAGNPPANAQQKALVDNCIGEYGICIDDNPAEGKFTYMVAGRYCGGEVPQGMKVYEFPAGEWAVFDCIGSVPEALQSLNTRIFKQWLPGNPKFELSGNATVEWYDCLKGEMSDPDYHSAIWIPVKRK